MAVTFKLLYNKVVIEEDISHLSAPWRLKIQHAIEEKLTTYPAVHGKPLRRSLRGYLKLRVGDYRVVFRISGNTILIIAILHRSIIYKQVEKRI